MGVTSVAVIGLGRMGLPIAHNLLERGFTVSGYHRTPGSELAGTGASLARSAADGAAHGDVLLSIVPDADAVDEVVTGRTGTLTAGGSPGMVAPRLATTFASGDRRSVDAVSGVLDAISGPWVYTGEFGTGASMKYVANMLLATHMAVAAEAMLLARSLGLDLELVQQTLDNSIGSSAIWRQRGPVLRSRQWTPAPGPIGTLHPILDQIAGRPALSASTRQCSVPPMRYAVRQGHGQRLGRARHRRRARCAGRHGPAPGAGRMRYSLVTFRDDGEVGIGVLLGGTELVAPPELKRWASMLELLEDWPGAAAILAGLELRDALRLQAATLLAPVIWPRKVLCAGVNYRKHIKEMGGEVPGDRWRPYFFLKPPSTTVIGPSDPIVIRDAGRARYDWDAELAVVIGPGGRDIPAERALEHVAGHCVANDVTARGYHRGASVPAEAFTFDWFAAKSADTSLPLGPGITPVFLVAAPQDLRLRLWVNGELQQDESTAGMICPVSQLIAAASAVVTLEPGDVVATGTPSGVGAARGLFLTDGDVVTVEIDGLGRISNRVVDAERRLQ